VDRGIAGSRLWIVAMRIPMTQPPAWHALRRSFSSAAAGGSEEQVTKMLRRQEDMLTQLMLKVVRLESAVGLQAPGKEAGSTAAAAAAAKEGGAKPVPQGKNPRGFVEYKRKAEPYRPAMDRIRDWAEVNAAGHDDPVERKRQAARCMDCGTPFCQTHTGCPVNNPIPEFNQLVLEESWQEAIDRLHSTNNFPEFTGRVCPAPCEGACVAGLVEDPVTIKNMEWAVIERAWEEGWVQPRPIAEADRSGKKVAIVGSGPAGLAAADQLNQLGHSVTVFEREDNVGGLLYYGIPNMKLDKRTVDRRVNLLREEGISFECNKNIGVNTKASDIEAQFDAVLLSVGATKPRGLTCPGSDLKGVHFAMEFLTANQKDLKLDKEGNFRNQWTDEVISAEGKNVVVVGGGDTGTDCIGTSLRHYCKSIVNLELMPDSPPERDPHGNPWPLWPKIHRVDYGHSEASAVFGRDPRQYSIATKRIVGDEKGRVKAVVTVQLEWKDGKMVEVPHSEEEIPCDLVLMAMGFVGPEPTLIDAFKLDVDDRGNVAAPYGKYNTSKPGVYAAGDCRRGQSLVVWAINEGRGAAERVNEYLVSKK